MDRPSFFFFSFELSYQKAPPKAVWAGLPRFGGSVLTNLLQSPHSLCRMVVRILA